MLTEADRHLFFQFTKETDVPDSLMAKYKLYQKAHSGLGHGPLPVAIMLMLCVESGLVKLPERKKTEFDDLEIGTKVKFFGGNMGWVEADFMGAEDAPDGMIYVAPFGDPGLKRHVLVTDVRLVETPKPQPVPEPDDVDEPVAEKKDEPKAPSPWDTVKPGTPIDVAVPGESMRSGTYHKHKFGRRTGKVGVAFPDDEKQFRWIDEAHCRVARAPELVGA